MYESALTSQAFGELMVNGLVEAYTVKFAADPVNTITRLETRKNSRSVRYARTWFQTLSGDIDLFVSREQTPLTLGEMFPTVRRRFSHPDNANIQCIAFAAEFKSSMMETSPNFIDKIKSFVRYYDKLLRGDYFVAQSSPLQHRNAVNLLRANRGIPILFVYNGIDEVAVRNEMERQLTAIHRQGDSEDVWQIEGHPIVVLYCESGSCTSWANTMRLELELEASIHRVEELEALLHANGIQVPPR